VCHSKRCADLIASTISRSEFTRHKTHAEFWRATPYPAYPKKNLIRFVQKIIAKTTALFAHLFALFIHSFEGMWLCLFYLFERITLFADASGWTSVKAILASRKTANIASGTVPARSQWKPLSKSLPHLGS
jgi:hypothetical protein